MSENNISVERDFVGTLHIKVGDFDYVQIQYQHPFTDNASTRALADRIVAFLAQPAEAEGVEAVAYAYIDETPEDYLRTKPFVLFAGPDGGAPGPAMAHQRLEPLVRLAALSAVTAERDRLRAEVEALRPIHIMILNALDRDAEEGKAARGEMAAELRAAMAARET
ncbi:hypothetical protein [Stutzerimonas nitrititolerans]|uniref:Uncharacterized protein n=1 Tax=Stutzerimonas nitrititolerans TaxID=2482751 RepID=A0ABX9UVB3_9GAMM|nr:hypothetical protein [Stutzerimonas nitrititolerans]RMH97310.1 hypothetical protein EA795_19215 [Stutzerimonas nitrititolerans]